MHITCLSLSFVTIVLLGASPKKMMSSGATPSNDTEAAGSGDTSPDNLFSEFYRLCQLLEAEPSYNAKTKIVADFIKHGSSGGMHALLAWTLSYTHTHAHTF